MSTSLHMFAEVKDRETGAWALWCRDPEANERALHDPIGPFAAGWTDRERDDYEVMERAWRSQEAHAVEVRRETSGLFRLLAGVHSMGRNRLITGGWAGRDEVLRGIPEDASSEVRMFMENPDYHSHNWVSVKELIDWQFWYEAWSVEGAYDEVHRALLRHMHEHAATLTQAERDAYIKEHDDLRDWPRPHTHVVTYADACADFYTEVIPTLIRLATPGEYDRVRLVYAFDN